jgi:hypothetical protein
MSVDQGRRALLESATAALFLTVTGTVAMRSGPVAAQGLAKSGHRRLLTITYPAGASIRFDADYYRDHHAKLFMDIYGSAIERFELRKIDPSHAGAFSAVINVWIADYDLFHSRSTPAAYQRMGDDKKNFTNASSSIQVDEVTHETGEPRANIPSGCECLSLLYPAGPAGAWSDEARCRAFIDGLTKLLGPGALRRVELRKGIEQLDDGSPTYQGGINLYARHSTFAKVWQRNRDAAQKLSTQLCSVAPVELSTTVFGIDSAPHKA